MSEQIDQTSELPWDKRSVSVRDILIVGGVIVLTCILTVSLLVYVFQENSGEVLASSALAAGDSMRGEALFTGATELQNGAPACRTCHRRAGFGPLGPGPDLTEVHKRYGEAGLPQTLQNLPFASMQGMFGNRPLTDSEVADLNAYFAQTNRTSDRSPDYNFVLIGLAMLIALLLFSGLLWRKRLAEARETTKSN